MVDFIALYCIVWWCGQTESTYRASLSGDAFAESIVGDDIAEHYRDHGAAQRHSQRNDTAQEAPAPIPAGQCTDRTHGVYRLLYCSCINVYTVWREHFYYCTVEAMVVFDFCTVFISHGKHPHLSIRECCGNDEYLEDKWKGYQNCFIMSHGDICNVM